MSKPPKVDPGRAACGDCGWTGPSRHMLTAINPFDKDDTISACPECKTLESTCDAVCDEPGCWQLVSCGFPTGDDNRYRNTCHTHRSPTI